MDSTISAGKQLTIQRAFGGGGSVVKLTGVIDDTIDRKKVIEGLKGVTVFDLEGVTRITSFGVREWIAGLKELGSGYYCFVNCHPVMVGQFNMVSGFGGSGQLVSLYAPYLCPNCNKEIEILIDLRSKHADILALKLPPVACPDCNQEAEFDDLPNSYFSYVVSAPVPSPPAVANNLINGDFSAAVATPFKIEKEIVENLTFLWFSGGMEKGSHFKRLADGLEGTVTVVMADMTSASTAGVGAFAPLAQAAGIQLFLARVPYAVAKVFAEVPRSAGRAKFISYLFPSRCTACGREFIREVPAQRLSLAAEGPCPSCSKPAPALVPSSGFQLLKALPTAEAPQAVANYLSAKPEGPVHKPSSAPSPATGEAEPSGPPQAPGKFGRYELVKRIGAGGMAEIFLARQLGPMGFEKKIILKHILPHLSAQPQFVEMFLQEARIAARISHPNVVQIFDLGMIGSHYFITMEYVKGWDLATLLKRSKQVDLEMPIEVACSIVSAICAGLHAAHTCVGEDGKPLSIVHRDISPQNVLISEEGNVKITDFGIAKASDTISSTEPGTVKGRFAYMAPELFLSNAGPIDGRVDLFATAIVLFQCIARQSPFRRDNDAATMNAIVHEARPKMSAFRKDVPPELDEIMERALAKDRNARYPTTEAFQKALEKFLASRRKGNEVSLKDWLAELASRSAMSDLGNDTGTMKPGFTPSPQPVDPAKTSTLRTPHDAAGKPSGQRADGTPRRIAAALSDDKLRAVYDVYVTAKRRCNEDVSKVTFEAVAAHLRRQVPELLKKSQANEVEFKVVIKDGKAVLMAIPK